MVDTSWQLSGRLSYPVKMVDFRVGLTGGDKYPPDDAHAKGVTLYLYVYKRPIVWANNQRILAECGQLKGQYIP